MSNSMEHDIRKERDRMAAALYEVVDAVAGIGSPWDLQGYGITARRAEEICELAEIGKRYHAALERTEEKQ